MKDWKKDPRYWSNVHTKGGFWTSGINANGLEMNDCQRLYSREHDRPLLTNDLVTADRYQLSDIHHLAVDECDRAREGRSAAYSWTEALSFYSSQPDFVPEVAKLGRLPEVPKPEDRGHVLNCLADRQDWYNRTVEDAELAVELQAEDFTATGGGAQAQDVVDGDGTPEQDDRQLAAARYDAAFEAYARSDGRAHLRDALNEAGAELARVESDHSSSLSDAEQETPEPKRLQSPDIAEEDDTLEL